MPRGELETYLQATKAGALTQAMARAAESDRLANEINRSKDQGGKASTRRTNLIAFCRLLAWPTWAYGMMFLAIALVLYFF